jgi:putative ABC transport system permease protein
MRFRLALRNVFRNRRRTALNVIMIAGGVSAIILFRGFANRITGDLRETIIKSQTGHLEIATPAFWEKSGKNPKDGLLPEYQKLVDIIRKLPHVHSVTGRVGFYGLVSTGDSSFSARGLTLDPVQERDKLEFLRIIDGETLKPGSPFQVVLGEGLAKTLRVKAGATVTVLTYTYDGVVNALDLEVKGIFRTGVSEFDETSFMMPLSGVQKLLDTDKVEQIVIGLDDTANTGDALKEVHAAMGMIPGVKGSMDSSVIIKTWSDLSFYLHQCEAFFRTQNGVFAFIILCLVVLGVLNTIGMSIMERAGEIGTLRALGDTERAILGQFTLEGFMLGTLGAVTGVISGTALAEILNAIKIPIIVPGASIPLLVQINLTFQGYSEGVVLAICAATLAAFLPALRASRLDIVEALRRNI